jgi:uncharacterized small protein (TIGR04563 family)
MSDAPRRKQSLYFPEDMLSDIQKQAARLDRSVSWIMQQCWRIAHEEIEKIPPPR